MTSIAERRATRADGDLWRYRSGLEISSDLRGFSVEAIDGGIGEVDECSTAVGGTYVVVDTGSSLGGQRVMLPGGLIERIDYQNQTVFLNHERIEIENAPAFVARTYRHDSYRTELQDYYVTVRARPTRSAERDAH